MAIKKQVDISVDAKQAISQMDELGSSFEDVFGEIKPLNTKIGEMEDALYQLAQAGDTSSKEFKDLSRTIGDYKKVIIETDMQVDAMAQTSSQNLGGAIEGVSGAFAVGTGMMGAFGVESEAVNEALLRVQSAMAITQGIQSIREGAKAFRGLKASIMATTLVQQGLNAVMKANPIGAVVTVIAALGTAVVALTGGFSNLKEKLTGVTAEQEMMSEVTAKAVDNIIDELAASEKLQNVLEDETINREDKIKAVKDLQKQYPNLLSNIDTEKTGLQDINKALKLNTKLLLLKAQQEAALELQKEKIKENVKTEIEKETGENVKVANTFNVALQGAKKLFTEGTLKGLTDLKTVKEEFNKVSDDTIKDNNKQITAYEKFQNQLQTQINLLEKEGAVVGNNASKASSAAKEKIDASREIEDAILANREESEAKEQEMNRIAFERFKKDTEQRVKDKEIEESDKVALIAAAEEKARLKRIEIGEKYKAIDEQAVKDAKLADEEKAALDLEKLTARLDAESEVKKAALEKQVEDNKKAEELKRAQQEVTAELSKQALQGIGDIANLVFDSQLAKAEGNEKEQDKIRRKAFNMNKAMQLGIATIQGVQAVQNAFATASASPITLVNPAYPFIQAGAAGLFSAINIAKIAAAKYQGGSVGSVTPPSGGGGAGAVPQFNVVGNSPQNQLAQSLGQGQDQPIQAFVVAGDVTSAQSLERNAIKTASL